MKLTRVHISAFLAVAVAAWVGVLRMQGTPVSLDHLRPFSAVVGTLVVLGIVFEHGLWRWPALHKWFVKRPDLRGTWRVELQSSYVDPRTNERVPLIVCYVAVTQTLSTLQMELMTPESKSVFIADHIRPSPSGEGYQVIGVYTNEPDLHLRDERISEMHQGALVLETHGASSRPHSLTGKYWTDRKTNGTMKLERRIKPHYTRFEDADAAFTQ